jgi:hypothetical protein
MKAQFKNPINNFAPVFLMLMVMFIFGFGCNSSKPASNPLAGWKVDLDHDPDQAIEKDYHDYIQKLPSEERKFAGGGIQFLEDGTGQHAILIPIGLNGTWWNHVLIYDKDDKRIKTIKYSSGGYSS